MFKLILFSLELHRNVNAAINNRFKPKKRRSSIPSPIHAKRKEAKFKPAPRKIKRERRELSTTEEETEDSDDDGYVSIYYVYFLLYGQLVYDTPYM